MSGTATRRLGAGILVASAIVLGGWASAHSPWASRSAGPYLVASDFAPTMSSQAATESRLEYFQARAEADPFGAAARAEVADVYLQRFRETGDLEDLRRAESAARASIDLRIVSNAKGFRMLAAALLAQHRFAEALEVARDLNRAWPDVPAYRALQFQILMESGRYDEAAAEAEWLEAYLDRLSVLPRLATWAELHGEVEKEGALLAMARELASYRSDLPAEQRAWYHYREGEHALRLGRLDAAEAAFRAGLSIEPGDRRIVSALVRLENARERWGRAVWYGERVRGAADLQTLVALGEAYEGLGDDEEAEKVFGEVEAAAAAAPEPFNRQLHEFRLDRGRKIQETRAILEEEILRRPDVNGWDLLAWARHLDGDAVGAGEAMDRALALGTRDRAFERHARAIRAGLDR